MRRLWVLLPLLMILVISLYGQISSNRSYRQLKDENDELHNQLAEIHSEAEEAQGELETLKSDVDDVQARANDCDDCDDVQSAASCDECDQRLREVLGGYNSTRLDLTRYVRDGIDQAIIRAADLDRPAANAKGWPQSTGSHVYRLMNELLGN